MTQSTGEVVRVHIDEFQFLITGGGDEVSGAAFDNGLASFDPEEISDAISITTGCHWGLVEVAVRREPQPPAVEDGWQDVVEFSVSCPSGLVLAEWEGEQVTTLADDGQAYRVRVSASGRDAGRSVSYETMTSPEWGEQPSGERYLIQVWPSQIAPAAVIRGAEDVPDADGTEVAHPELATGGFAAAVEINKFVTALPDGSRLADAAEVRVERWYDAPGRGLYEYLAEPGLWMACSIPSAEESPAVDGHSLMHCMGSEGNCDHPLIGRLRVEVRWEAIEVNDSVDMTWTWCRPPHYDRATGVGRPQTPILETQVHIDLAESASPNGATGTQVSVRHRGFPETLTTQVQAFWAWQLEYLESRL